TTTVTYSAGATLRAIREGTKLRVYYNNALVGSELTMTANTNTKHGLFSTYSGNSFDNFTLWARGTGNEYVNLPDTDLTATKDTSVHYSGASSLKLVADTSDNGYTQSYTLPNTNNYTLSAFAYTDGSAVTSSDVSLENGDVNLTTTYTSVGNGWYKLSSSFAGVASSRNYGVKVKAGRTVYVDNLSLFASSGSGNTLAIANSTTGLGGLSVESTTTLNSGLAGLQALIVKGFSGQTEDLQEWQDSTGAVLGSLTPSGGLSLTGNLDINGTSNDIAGSLNLSGNSLTSTGALTITPASGNNVNISLGTTGDFKVNTNDLVVDTSEGRVGIGTTTPSAKLHVIALTEQERLGYDTSNYWTSTVGITGALTMQGVGTGGALTLSPTAGQNLNVTLATTGDFIVNTNDLVADTSSGYIGINTTAPTSLLDIGATSGVDGLRLTNSGTKVLGLSYGTNSTTWDATSTDPTNKLTNGTFDADLTSWSEEPSYTLVPDPGLWYASQARTAGKTAIIKVNSASGIVRFGWTIASGSGIGTEGFNFNGSIYDTGIAVANSFSTGTDYLLADVLRGTGHYMFIKGGAYTNWTLLYTTKVTTTTPMYPFVGQAYGASVFTADNIRIPTATWLPTPLAYDTFTRADGAIGSSETTGPDEQTTPALEWTGGAISGNTNVITPTVGDSVVTNGDFASWSGDNPTGWTLVDTEDANNYVTEVSGKARLVSDNTKGTGINQNTATTGTWYQFNVDLTDSTLGTLNAYIGGVSGMAIGGITGVGTKLYTGRAASTLIQINRGATEDITIDNFLVKPLTLSSLFSTVSTSDSDVIADANVTLTAGTQAGLVLNLDSTSSPANFIIIYHDGTSVKVDEAVAGVYTNKQTTTVTYSAGATLRVIREGTKLRVYYNNALVGAELTMTANTNIKHGLFSTYSGNSFDNFSLFPRGTGGEYEEITPTTLTATRETTIKYNNSTASVKLVGGTTYGDYLQSANVGDTETYNLIAYAYTDGSVVTSADLSLYYDTTTLTTTYTPMGGTGWYKLTGSFTGVASSKNYGVRVKAGKTVYVDEVKVQVGVGSTQTMYVLDSNTGVTGLNVQGLINGTLNGVATYTKAGTISDSDFSGGATDGLLGIDTTNHRIYFREGGEWHYAARTAGFQIPKEEVAGLSIGDTLIPYVETFMSDGAVHGLYRKLDINQLLNTPEALQFEGNTSLVGRVSFGDKDMAGIATVKTYTDQVRVNFTTPYQVAPMVNISLVADQTEDNTLLSEGLEATITEVTPGGFTILLDRLALRDYVYNWVAIMAPQAITTKSTSELMTIMMSPIPVATGSSGFE
ncbi:MAG: Carbohydrate-binding CenC domain protein, partial [Microgenomates group bacterium GW2011_GWA1_46_7]